MSVMTENKTETFEPVDFSNVHEGDRLKFVNANNGYGSSGDDLWRTGTVTKVTEKSVTVEITGFNPLLEEVFVGGKARKLGRTARLRRADWHYRCVSRVVTEKPARRPFNAENVKYVDQGNIVSAVWCSDPAIAPEVALENDLRSITGDVPYEVAVIAEATRFTKKEGADFSGWVVRCGVNYGDSLPNKREAMKHLRWAVAERFSR